MTTGDYYLATGRLAPASDADLAAAGMRRAFIVELAREQYQREGAIEIDEGAVLSEGNDNGTYVAAWVWVSFEDTPFDKTGEAD